MYPPTTRSHCVFRNSSYSDELKHENQNMQLNTMKIKAVFQE